MSPSQALKGRSGVCFERSLLLWLNGTRNDWTWATFSFFSFYSPPRHLDIAGVLLCVTSLTTPTEFVLLIRRKLRLLSDAKNR